MPLSDSPIVQDAPAISGLAFRHFVSAADYPAMAAVRSGSVQHDQIDPHSSREGVPSADDHRGMLPEEQALSNPDLLLATMHDQVIGYNHVLWRWTEVTGIRVYLHLGYLLPEWRNKGIGQAMLHWAQQRIRAIAAADQPDDRATFATNVSTTEHEADALIRHAGYTDVRRLSDMAAVLSSPPTVNPMSQGIDVRPVEPDHYRPIYQAMKDAYSDMWSSTPESEDDFQEFLSDHVNIGAFDPTLWQIAWAGDVVAGLAITRIQNGIGHIAEVSVRRDWHRHGIARGLMQRAFSQLHDRGVEHVRLYTDAANGQGARSLYESLGFREVKQHIFYRKLLSTP